MSPREKMLERIGKHLAQDEAYFLSTCMVAAQSYRKAQGEKYWKMAFGEYGEELFQRFKISE